MTFEYPEGATPLAREEMQGLKLPHITDRGQLNLWEQENILEARRKFFGRKQRNILSVPFLLRLHKAMFGKVWNWAGKLRTSDKNIGVPHWDVGVRLAGLCEDARLWVESGRDPADEIAALFHHRLVSIHPFANGNGRHARMMADLLLVHTLGKKPFSWGSRGLADPEESRRGYLAALRAADARDYGPLFAFVRN
jgi:Fic-DOC domain mobile mystery protein B